MSSAFPSPSVELDKNGVGDSDLPVTGVGTAGSTLKGEGGIDAKASGISGYGRGGSAGRSTSHLTVAAISVRNSLPHVLPGILLSVGDTHASPRGKDTFLPDQTTPSDAMVRRSSLIWVGSSWPCGRSSIHPAVSSPGIHRRSNAGRIGWT